jgi:uncharacterized repeat protein (TIGR03847 family)
MSTSFELDSVDRFVVGTVGEPGNRTFFFQVVAPGVLLSFKCEKVQVAALTDALKVMMTDLPPATPVSGVWANLDTPVLAEWAVGSIGIGYESAADRVVLLLEELREDPDDGSQARFFLTRDQIATFIEKTPDVVSGGRPTCVLCSSPVDAEGYNCSCYN